VVQGAHYEDLRRTSARFLGAMEFDGYGLGGAFEKERIGEIVRWMSEELPDEKPRHMLGISEPNDIFTCIENGADTFDCVSPARVGRNGAIYTLEGRINITNAKYKTDFSPLVEGCDCYTCQHYTKAYLHHLFRAGELLGLTLATIHNEQFIVTLVDEIRNSIQDQSFEEYKKQWLHRFYA
jgi:queuine tRNA-ribosyltransferase